MSEYRIKLAGALPKEGNNGWDEASMAMELAEAVADGHVVPPRVAVVLYDVKGVNIGTDGIVTVTVRVRRVQPVAITDNLKAIESILVGEFKAQTGTAIQPFEVEQITKAAFRDLPKSVEEIDAQEAEEQDTLSPTDELRRHLERVHGIGEALNFTAEEAEAKHETQHAGELPLPLAHDPEWFGWTRAEIEAQEAESDGEPDDGLFPAGGDSIPSADMPAMERIALEHSEQDDSEGDLFSHAER